MKTRLILSLISGLGFLVLSSTANAARITEEHRFLVDIDGVGANTIAEAFGVHTSAAGGRYRVFRGTELSVTVEHTTIPAGPGTTSVKNDVLLTLDAGAVRPSGTELKLTLKTKDGADKLYSALSGIKSIPIGGGYEEKVLQADDLRIRCIYDTGYGLTTECLLIVTR